MDNIVIYMYHIEGGWYDETGSYRYNQCWIVIRERDYTIWPDIEGDRKYI